MKKIIVFCFALVTIITSNSAYAGGGRLCDSTIESCPNLVISTSNTTVKEGTQVVFNWESTNGIACRIGDDLVTSGTFTRALYQTQDIYFACPVRDYSSSARSNFVKIKVSPIVISGDLFTSREEIVTGQKIRVRWNIKNAEKCWLNGEEVPTKKSYVDAPERSQFYYLYCINGRKSYTLSNFLNVRPKAIWIRTDSLKKTINIGDSTKIIWDAKNATTCSVNGVKYSPIGEITVSPDFSQYYNIVCSNGVATAKSIFVEVIR